VRGYLALARISNSLPLEVPIDVATLYDFARVSAHKDDNYFLLLEEVLRLKQGYSTKILSGKGLTLELCGGKSITP
jgi:hypothetical protein